MPQSTTWNVTNPNCTDIDYKTLKQDPAFYTETYAVALQKPTVTYNVNVTFPVTVGTELQTFIDSQHYSVDDLAIPTLYAIQQNPSWTPPSTEVRNIMTIPDQYQNQNVRVILQAQGFGTHPFHLHGHGFQVVASGLGPFNDTLLPQVDAVDLSTTIVRDTAILDGNGWLVIQYVSSHDAARCATWILTLVSSHSFTANNPGVWALHCHIGKLNQILPFAHFLYHHTSSTFSPTRELSRPRIVVASVLGLGVSVFFPTPAWDCCSWIITN